MQFNTSEDLPFNLRGGDDEQTAMFNRIAGINRVNYLVQKQIQDFDLREKSKEFILALDMELWKKYYQKEGRKKIDEEFCQRAAKVCVEMENPEAVFSEQMASINNVQSLLSNPSPKPSFFSKIMKKIRNSK